MGGLDIPTSVEVSPQQYLSWRGVAEDFGIDNLPQKRNRLQNIIADYFGELQIPTRNISRVENHNESNFIIITVGEDSYYFDIYSEQYCGASIDEASEFRESNPNNEVLIILQGIPVLQTVVENSGWYLNRGDTVDFNAPEQFSGMTARELQMTIRGNIEIFERNGGLLGIDVAQRNMIIGYYRQYLEIVMGIGDTYEEGSGFFHKTEPEIDLYLRSVVFSFSSTQECFDYYRYIQTEIEDNRASSKKNKEAYSIFSKKLGQLLFERLQREFNSAEDEEEKQEIIGNCNTLIKLITDRSETNIDNNLRDPLLAEEICIFIISRPGGVLDSLENCSIYSLDFTDPVVGNSSPESIITGVEQKLIDCGIKNSRSFLRNYMGIHTQLIVRAEINSYSDLSLEHKRQISILARLIEKIDSGELNPEELSDMSEGEVSEYIVGLGEEITSEAYEAVREAYDRNFELRALSYTPPDFMSTLQQIGVSETDIEAFELFDDIRGNSGLFNFSDENLNMAGSLARSAGIIVGTIAVVMIATAITGGLALPAMAPSLIAAGGGLTTTGSLISIGTGATIGTAANMFVFDPRTHDSMGEMLSDVGSDFIVNTFHAVYMERLTMALWSGSSNLGRAGLLSGDFASGAGIEVIRENMINAIYQGEPLLGENHSMSIEEAFWFSGYTLIESEITPEMNQRFLECSNIFYLWNGYDVSIESEPEFKDIDWSSEAILGSLSEWMERQETRI